MTIASPESTGHAGPYFEQHVDAAFLALLLVRGTAPFLLRGEVSEVHLQSSHLGWATDDLLVVGVTADGQQRRALLSVKRTVSIAKSDPECVDVFAKAWSDFRSSAFDSSQDIIGLVTRPGSARMARGLRVLLETARAAGDGADFVRRLELPKYRDKYAREYAATIREIIEAAHTCKVGDDELQRFLASFDFVLLDLNAPSSTMEALLLSLLRANANAGELPTVAAETWNELLQLVSSDSQAARSFRSADLPLAMRQRFSVTGSHFDRLMEPFDEMTRTVCKSAESDIAGHHEPREELEQEAIDCLDANQVLLLSGLAGSGKSAVARSVFEAVGHGRLAIAVRAEMLARSSIGEALLAIGTTLKKLREVTALHSWKVLWIDGAERLLEKKSSEREAFHDVLRLVRDDPTWRIIITCRAYSLETFKAAFLDQRGIASHVLLVPAMTDDQLDSFSKHCPELARPLSSPQLRSLLSNPFFLKMAATMRWPPDDPLPVTEREFRGQVWKQCVRRDDDSAEGMPLRRDTVYLEVALRRAQSMEVFVEVQDLDASAVLKLQADTLLLENDDVRGRYAPSHDVLEDWALLEWLDRAYLRAHQSWSEFLNVLGTYPAIRRAFRTWLTDRVETIPGSLKAAAELINDESVARYWTDDALVAVLRMRDPAPFLAEYEEQLLDDDCQLLKRTIHLTRVACQQAVTDTSEAIAAGEQLPVGLIWERLSSFIAKHLDRVVPQCAQLLLRFVHDWSVGVTALCPYPPGSAEVGQIVCRLLDDVNVHRRHRNADVTTLLKVLLRIPREAEGRIRQLANESSTPEFRHDSPFVELVLSHLHGAQLCRDLPDVVVAIAERLLAPRPPVRQERRLYRARESLAERFGLAERIDHYGHPPSALHGPFLNLLRIKPRDGLRLTITTINRCSEAILSSENDGFECSFVLPDGHTVRHAGSPRLWAMFRTNSGPDVLRSMLMALESWLLDLGDRGHDEVLSAAAMTVMLHGRSFALSAVVASATMAFPRTLADLGLAFLRNRELYDLDRARWVQDQTPVDRLMSEAFPARDVDTWLFNHERIEAAERWHRRSNFELLAHQLQDGRLRAETLALLDELAALLPPESEQDDEDRLWRLALHRMDSRNIQVTTQSDGRSAVAIAPIAEDVQAVVDREQPLLLANQRAREAFLWIRARYERSAATAEAGEVWRVHLEHVRTQPGVAFSDATLLMAVVCLRDFFDELTDDEREWCVNKVCDAFADDVPGRVRGFGPPGGTSEAASELAALVVKFSDREERNRLEAALTRALLIEEHDVSRRAAFGIGHDLWEHDPPLAMSLATAIAHYTRSEFETSMRFARVSPWEERDTEGAARASRDLKAEMVEAVANRVVDMNIVTAADYRRNPDRIALHELSDILRLQSGDRHAAGFMTALQRQLIETWAADSAGERDDDRKAFDEQTEDFVTKVLCFYALGLADNAAVAFFGPFREAASLYPEEVAELLRELASTECDRSRPKVFWSLWSLLSDALIDWANATSEASDSVLDAIAGAVFLSLPWKETTTSWRSMTGHEDRLAQAFARLRASEEVVDRFIGLLTSIGGALLPSTLPLVAQKLLDANAVLSDRGGIRLERALASLIYSGSPQVRQRPALRDATLSILGVLIDLGSSKAYRMRDDFLTPVRAAAAKS